MSKCTAFSQTYLVLQQKQTSLYSENCQLCSWAILWLSFKTGVYRQRLGAVKIHKVMKI